MIPADKTYSFGWLYLGTIGSAVRRFNSFNHRKSTDARYTGAGLYVTAPNWQDPPTAPRYVIDF